MPHANAEPLDTCLTRQGDSCTAALVGSPTVQACSNMGGGMSPRTRVLLAGALVLGEVSAACSSWRVQSATPQELLAREHPYAIQVREHGGAEYVLGSPRLEGDSLTGYVKRVERRIPIATVGRVAVRRPNAIKTVGLIVGIPLAGIAALLGLYGLGCAVDGGCSSIAP